MKPINEVLLRPLITEKATRLQEQNRYVFQVSLRANRQEVKQAVEQSFKVKVTRVNMIKVRGETKRSGPRAFRTPDRKKAIVLLKEGDKIPIFENV